MKNALFLEGYTTKKILAFFGVFVLGILIAYLAKIFVPYIQENPIGMFVIFPLISLPLCFLVLWHKPKCQKCGAKTKAAPTPAGSDFDFLECSQCGQAYKIRSTTRS